MQHIPEMPRSFFRRFSGSFYGRFLIMYVFSFSFWFCRLTSLPCKYTSNIGLQSVSKIMGKTTIWAILCFSLIPALFNVEEQWVKLAASNVMGSQHCIGGEGKF